MDNISVIIPIYNEIQVLLVLIERLRQIEVSQSNIVTYNFIFVDDGSSDGSYEYLKHYAANKQNVSIVSFSRNFGHQIAVSAGIDYANGDYVAIIDADLQDPPELIYEMYALAKEQNCDVIYGQRVTRDGETLFKKISSNFFYKLINYMCDNEMPLNTGDFRVITNRVVRILRLMPEKHRYIRGLVPWIGFKSMPFAYHRQARHAGITKYPLKKMIQFALNAIFSFSRKPISLGLGIGSIAVILGALLAIVIISLKLFSNIVIPGLASTLVAITIFSGVQIILIGLVGEYVGRIYEEVKFRPLYIVKEEINAIKY
jgi:dolichol-phosphate mannosyltransferase